MRLYGWSMLLGVCLLAGCGGGGGGPPASSTSGGGGVTAPAANVVPIAVNSGPPAAGGISNIPYVSLTLCEPGSTTACQTISDIQVDTGSSGLRVFASVLVAAGLNLPVMADPANSANTVAECVAFLDGYVWGPVATADLTMGGESASAMQVHVLNDNGSYVPSVPSGCTAETVNTDLDSVAAYGANGVIGVGLLTQDCGPFCAMCDSMGGCTSMDDPYYSCNASSNTCTSTQVAQNAQVANPVSLFQVDNNGVIVQLQSVPQAGAVSATGSLIFGIGTQSNNVLGNAQVLTLDENLDFTATFNGTAFNSSFIDSGSSAFFFADSSLPTCPSPNQSFYCPPTPQALTASNQGHLLDGTPSGEVNTVGFTIVGLSELNATATAIDDIGVMQLTSAGTTPLTNDFDFGLPFFYGRSVYTGIIGRSAGADGPTGPYYAY
jgi:hypothetical protein